MFNCNADGVEENEYNNKPVKPLGFNGVSDPETKSLLCSPEPNAGSFVHPRLQV